MVFIISIQILIDHPVRKHGDPDQTPHSVASDLGLHCLPMSYKKDARLIWVKTFQGLFQLSWEKAPGLNLGKICGILGIFRSVNC